VGGVAAAFLDALDAAGAGADDGDAFVDEVDALLWPGLRGCGG